MNCQYFLVVLNGHLDENDIKKKIQNPVWICLLELAFRRIKLFLLYNTICWVILVVKNNINVRISNWHQRFDIKLICNFDVLFDVVLLSHVRLILCLATYTKKHSYGFIKADLHCTAKYNFWPEKGQPLINIKKNTHTQVLELAKWVNMSNTKKK